MKKVFSKVLMILALATTGFTMTSCDEDTISQLINILTQLNQGEELYFSGSSTIQHATRTSTSGQYTYTAAGNQSFASHGLNMVVQNSQAAIALGDFTIEGATISGIELPAVTYNNGTIGDSNLEYVYSVTATITQNGQSQTVSTSMSGDDINYPYAFVGGTVNSAGTLNLNIQIHLSDYECYIISYKGTSSGNQ